MDDTGSRFPMLADELGELPVAVKGRMDRSPIKKLHRYMRGLASEYKKMYALAVQDEELPMYGETLVSEFYSIEKQMKLAADSFERLRLTNLPRFTSGRWIFCPRIYALAIELVRARQGVLDVNSLTVFFEAYQAKNTLTTRELGLLTDMLRLSLIEMMYDCINGEMLDGDRTKLIRNLLMSLSRLADSDIAAAIKALNLPSRTLMDDGVYRRMDDSSRERYLEAAAALARRLHVSENAIALAALKLARDDGKNCGRESHAGYYLLAEGRGELIKLLRPDKKSWKMSTATKLFAIVAIELILTAVLILPLFRESIVSFILGVLPMLTLTNTLIISVITRLVKPAPLPRLSLEFEVGRENRTLVCVPVLITSEESVRDAIRNLETHYLANRLDNTEYAVIGDFRDSDTERREGEDELIECAKGLIWELNQRYPCADADIFHYLHRKRSYSVTDNLYMGRERKRGAVVELLNCMSGGKADDIMCNYPALKPGFRFLTVLDADTVMPAGTLKKLIGTAAHPLNEPVFSDGRKPISGYTVIVPRMASTSRSAAKSRFARLISGDSGMSAYAMSVSDFFQDVFSEGCFGGKGIINIDAFIKATEGIIPDNTVLSHDLLEGCLSRAGLADDIVLYDGEPSSFAAWWKRRHRWTRGDVQLLPFLCGRLSKYTDALAKFKLAGNIRRCMFYPAVFIALVVSLFAGLPILTAGAIVAFFIDPIISIITAVLRLPVERMPLKPMVMLIRRRLYELAALPYAAMRDVDAMVRALYRMRFSHRNMLEWQTAADSSRSIEGFWGYIKLLLPCIIAGAIALAASALGFLGVFGTLSLLSLIFALIWLVSPIIVMELDKKDSAYSFTDAERAELMHMFACTWRYFEDNCTEATAWLPPDNYQEHPYLGAAPLTSPTNIGMGIMAVVSAYDMGFIDREGMVMRLERMLNTIERMEKWHGHLFNWYSLGDLSLLKPRFISTVDSGNLFASLITAARALYEPGDASVQGSDKGNDERKRNAPTEERNALEERCNALATRCEAIALGMDFSVLYDKSKKLFHIGCEFDEGRLTESWYDLLASESRLASFSAIAFGEIGTEHWFSLSRLASDADGGRVLKSWSGTMFEYLMPLIFLDTVPHSMQYEVCRNAVLTQVLLGSEKHPWGVSESGYYAFDRSLRYQYRAFGNRELALAPCRERTDVIAPYATMLALMIEPKLAAENLRRIRDEGALGRFGMYEAIDYTPAHIGDKGSEIVKSYMAHHQGMSLCAINNALNDNIIVKRFMSIPNVRANEQLLFEAMPCNPITISTYDSDIFRERRGESRNAAERDAYIRCADNRGEIRDERSGIGQMPIKGQLLSNGNYSAFVTAGGNGFSKCGGIMLTRYKRFDVNSCGIDFVVQNGSIIKRVGANAVFEPHKVTFTDRQGAIRSRLEIMVSADFNCEIRTLTLINCGRTDTDAHIGIFSEIALAPQDEDEAHPAFVRIGVDAEETDGAIIFTSRKKPDREERVGFFTVMSPVEAMYCTDGLILPSRHMGHIQAMRLAPRERAVNLPIEPYFSAMLKLRLAPGESRTVTLIAGVAKSRSEALNAMREQRLRLAGAPELARAQAQGILRAYGMNSTLYPLAEDIAAHVLTYTPLKKTMPAMKTTLHGVRELWRFGISGDMPVMLVSVSTVNSLKSLRALADIHRYLHEKGARYDLVIIGEYPHEYANALRLGIEEIIRGVPYCVLLHGYLLNDDDSAFLYGIALLSSSGENLVQTLNDAFASAEGAGIGRMAERSAQPAELMPIERKKLFDYNGYGGFDLTAGEYVIYVKPDRTTPLPWSNIIANEGFGTLVTESGGGFTWRTNARLGRLTPWTNDAIYDYKGERLMLLDLDEHTALSLTPNGDGEYEVRHGYGYSVFSCRTGSLDCRLTETVDAELPIKYYNIEVLNRGLKRKRLRLELGFDWVLGAMQRDEALRFERKNGIILVKNLLGESDEYGFAAILDAKSGYSDGSLSAEIIIDGGSEDAITAIIGCDRVDRVEADTREASFERAMHVNSAVNRSRLGKLRVRTEDQRFDAIVNGHLLYQTYASRLLGRTGFYQSGGAIGFRDQLQDVLALLQTDPLRARRQILVCASKQFEQGDVLHWWHDDGRGVRTRITDDKLFLPYAAAEYAQTEEDYGIFRETCPYLYGEPIPEGRKDVYERFDAGEEKGSLYEHCLRAIDSALVFGSHGLPLMGGGDWNDGMDCVGENGGESVFLGWFLVLIIEKLKPVFEYMDDAINAQRLNQEAEKLRKNLEKEAWDGTRYIRAFFSDGTKLGGAECTECAIDCLSQCFAVFAGGEHGREAFGTLLNGLVDTNNSLIRLLTPPFSGQTGHRVGYIEGYIPGVRENGGQYTHAAAWCVIAACMLGEAETAQHLFKLINPAEHGELLKIERYKAEPYVVAGDVYAEGRLAGRAGWTWYTGAAGWIYRATVEYILGIKKRGRKLCISPCTTMESFCVEYRYGAEDRTLYRINARRTGKNRMTLDGEPITHIPLTDDARMHEVAVEYR